MMIEIVKIQHFVTPAQAGVQSGVLSCTVKTKSSIVLDTGLRRYDAELAKNDD